MLHHQQFWWNKKRSSTTAHHNLQRRKCWLQGECLLIRFFCLVVSRCKWMENLFMFQKSCDKKSYELPLSFVRFLSTVFTVQIFNAHIFYQQQGSIFLLLFSPNHAVACCYFSNVVSILKIVRVSGLFRLSRDSSRTPTML